MYVNPVVSCGWLLDGGPCGYGWLNGTGLYGHDVAADPYIVNGLALRYRMRRWDTVVGNLAANPLR